MQEQQTQFEGWAVVELFGHSKEVGFVTTRYFGTAAMFQVDVPELPEREYEIPSPQWLDGKLAPAGTKVLRAASPPRTRFIGPSAVYAMNPCSEGAARSVIERMTPRDISIVSLPEGKQLADGDGDDDDYDDAEI